MFKKCFAVHETSNVQTEPKADFRGDVIVDVNLPWVQVDASAAAEKVSTSAKQKKKMAHIPEHYKSAS